MAECGEGYFKSVLVEVLERWGAPAMAGVRPRISVGTPAGGPHHDRAVRDIERVLKDAAAETAALGYAVDDVATVLDQALFHYLDDLLHLSLREKLFPR